MIEIDLVNRDLNNFNSYLKVSENFFGMFLKSNNRK